jgi:hypothetical protein
MTDDPFDDLSGPTPEQQLGDQVVDAILRELDHSLRQVVDRHPWFPAAFVHGQASLHVDRSGVDVLRSPLERDTPAL